MPASSIPATWKNIDTLASSVKVKTHVSGVGSPRRPKGEVLKDIAKAQKSKVATKPSPKGASPCKKQTSGRYTSPKRKSPPFPAGACKGTTKRGKDGKMWISKKVGKSQVRWYPSK